MKKKKAAMLARKLEAEKQLAAKKSSTTDSDDKSLKEEDSSAVEVVDVDKSEEKQTTVPPKPQLASVPETTEAKDVPTTDAPKMTFGSSSTVLPPSTFGSMPKPPAKQSEPDCPKPTFGSSGFGSGVAPPTFGSASTTTFGGAAASKPSTTGFGATTSTKPAEDSSKGSGAFLNLTPPKTGNTPGKFVFGSGAPITLAAPSTTSMDAAQTLASFGQPAKFGTGFGTSSGGFGSVAKPSAFGSSPFGGGAAGDASKKRPLDSATTDEKGEGDDSQPDAKKVHTEEEEKEADADESTKDEAAKEA